MYTIDGTVRMKV